MAGLTVRRLGRVDCAGTIDRMRAYTAARDAGAADELWLCEHLPVYTLGIAGKAEHVRDAQDIPVLQTDRGGQVTYHGPGQVVAYPLVDLKRLGVHVKEYVYRLEQAVIRTLEAYGVTGHRVAGAPGVYLRLAEPFGHAPLDARSPAERQATRAAPVFDGLGKVAALGISVTPLRLPRCRAERGDGPPALRRHRPVRLPGAAHGRSFYNRGSGAGRRCRRNAGVQAERLPERLMEQPVQAPADPTAYDPRASRRPRPRPRASRSRSSPPRR